MDKKELQDRSVTGTPYIRYASSGKCNVRLPMTPEKLNTLKDLFRLYVGKDPLAQQRLKAVRNHLAVGLYDIRHDQDLGSCPGELDSGQSKLDGSQHDLGQQTIIGSSRDKGLRRVRKVGRQGMLGLPDEIVE
ncbi:hypothetical protein HPB51_019942 [Rhipicephalus microplus]|uniref:Uncharacterized protein n=1 Tax=Rhipicephalus microplus TaxID=6941 RepID=A0A9J6E3Z6_RHIMP|nr:hypothetical protein HPB51_019942 [Rhipicephalus microplus]